VAGSDTPSSKLAGGAWIALAYVLALVAGYFAGRQVLGEHPLWVVLAADVAGTVVVFAFSRGFSNSSFYDAYWSLGPMAIAVYLALFAAEPGVNFFRQIVVVALVWWWGGRLTYNWWRQWTGLSHEDWRYVDLREKSGAFYPFVDLFGIHLFPTVQVFLGCLALYPCLCTSGAPFGGLDVLAAVITAGSIYIETRADVELHDFVHGDRQPGQILNRGLWAYSRHPNYFGEIGFWVGLALLGYAADPSFVWSGSGALTITIMFVFVSVPMLDDRSLERRPAYAEHMRRVSGIIPWFPSTTVGGGQDS